MSPLVNAWQDAVSQWQSNPRLRLIIMAAALVAVFVVYLKATQWRDQQIAEAERVYQQLQQARNVAGQADWKERRDLAAQRLKAAQ